MNRRDLIQRVLVGGAVLVMAPSVLNSCTKDSTTDPSGTGTGTGSKVNLDLTLPANAALANAGGSVVIQGIIIINTGGGNYIALSSTCTHQGCTVAYNQGAGNIQCPCHGSVYTTTGSVVQGPAARALQSYPVSVAGNVLSISV
jgi:cytochrome b6-f complex iron-sulfur subunit